MAREDLHFRLRIPEDLKNRIEAHADLNNRSMTAEIISRLTASVNDESRLRLVQGEIEELRVNLAREQAKSAALEEFGELQIKFIEAQSRENEALRKASITSEHLIYQLAHAIMEAADGDRKELEDLIERERREPIMSRLWTAASAVDEK